MWCFKGSLDSVECVDYCGKKRVSFEIVIDQVVNSSIADSTFRLN